MELKDDSKAPRLEIIYTNKVAWGMRSESAIKKHLHF